MSLHLATIHRRRAALLRDLADTEDALADAHAAEVAAVAGAEWVPLDQWCRERGYSPDHVRSRIRLLVAAGDARKVGSRWEIRRLAELPLSRLGHRLPRAETA